MSGRRSWAGALACGALAASGLLAGGLAGCGEEFSGVGGAAGAGGVGGGQGATGGGGTGPSGGFGGAPVTCTLPSQCDSGFCVDGYCCNAACAGICLSCALDGREGQCRPLPAGTDPDGECADAAACDGAAACALGGPLWSRAWGSTGDDIPWGLTLDSAGNIWLTGGYEGPIDFGGGALAPGAPGAANIFVVKRDANGNHIDSGGIGGALDDHGNGVAAGPFGQVVIVGAVQQVIEFGGACPASAGIDGLDGYVALLESTGNCSWLKSLNGADAQEPTDVAFDAANDAFIVAGNFRSTLTGILPELVAQDLTDAFVLSLTVTSGETSWSRAFGGQGLEFARAVGVDQQGNAWVGGDFDGTITLESDSLAAAGTSDAYLVKLDPAGNVTAAIVPDGPGFERLYDLAVQPDGTVIVVGDFDSRIDFGGGAHLSGDGPAGETTDIFVARYRPSGALDWSRSFGGYGGDHALGVAVHPSGVIAVTGSFAQTIDFGGGELSGAGGQLFVAKLASDGTHLWSHEFGGAGSEAGSRVAFADDRGVLLAAKFQGELTVAEAHTSSGLFDLLLARFAP